MNDGWTEADSATYRKLEAIAVPRRAEQLATVLTLLPFSADAPARVIDVACGGGATSVAILSAFPQATVLGLDGSSSMRARAEALAKPEGSRFETMPFELGDTDWFSRLDGADAVVSSLAVHHLAADAKRRLFEAVAERASPGGALLLADLVEPTSPRHRELFAGAWTHSARAQAIERDTPRLFDAFDSEQWNVYRHPDPLDQPSPLADQLEWLSGAGFDADCYWLQAGHAVYGGYLPPKRDEHEGIDFDDAMSLAGAVLGRSEGET